MRRHVFARVLASTVLVLTATEIIGGGTHVGAAAPPSLDGQRFYWAFNSPGAGEFPLHGVCNPDGTTSLALDLPTDLPTYDVQYLPDIGNWGTNPYPDLPYTGPLSMSVTGSLNAHTLPSPPLDFATGWLNEQQSTRGLPAAPVTAFAGFATIDAPDANVEITLSIPETGAIGYGSCHEQLPNAVVDSIGTVAVTDQFRLKVMNVEYSATITTSSGVYHDTGTAVFSARSERYVINPTSGSSGGGMEMIFTSTAPADSDGPTITCHPDARVLLHQDSATVTATVSDEGSGVSSPTLTVPVDTSVVGPQTVSLTATDLAGNSTTVECTVVVAYVVEFRDRPGHHDDDDDGHGHEHDRDDRRRHGAEVVRWRLLDADGRWAGGPSSVVSVTVERPGHPTTILGGSAVSYQRRGRWQATVRPRLATGDAVLVIALDDSTTHAVALR